MNNIELELALQHLEQRFAILSAQLETNAKTLGLRTRYEVHEDLQRVHKQATEWTGKLRQLVESVKPQYVTVLDDKPHHPTFDVAGVKSGRTSSTSIPRMNRALDNTVQSGIEQAEIEQLQAAAKSGQKAGEECNKRNSVINHTPKTIGDQLRASSIQPIVDPTNTYGPDGLTTVERRAASLGLTTVEYLTTQATTKEETTAEYLVRQLRGKEPVRNKDGDNRHG